MSRPRSGSRRAAPYMRRSAHNPMLGWLAVLALAGSAYYLTREVVNPSWLLVWWCITGAFTCALYGFDKMAAQSGSGRISEMLLLMCNLVGGWIGGWIGMLTFRHKTNHGSFYIVQTLSAIVHLGAGYWWWG